MIQSRDFRQIVFHRTRYVAPVLAASLALALLGASLDGPLVYGDEPTPRRAFIVYLQDQEQAAIAQQVNAKFAPQLEALSQQAEAADRVLWPLDKLPPLATRDEEVVYMEQLAQGRHIDLQAQEVHDQAISALSDLREEIGREIAARSMAAHEQSQAEAARVVAELGGEFKTH